MGNTEILSKEESSKAMLAQPLFDPCIETKPKKLKIERVGASKLCIDLICNTDLSYRQIANKINNEFKLDDDPDKVGFADITNFLKLSSHAFLEIQEKRSQLAKTRAALRMDKERLMLKTMDEIDEEIENVKESKFIDPSKRAAAVSGLIHKRLLAMITYAKLNGEDISSKKITNIVSQTQVNINNPSATQSELMQRLASAPTPVKENEDKSRNS